MRELSIEGLSDDEQFLVLTDPTTDERFALSRSLLATAPQPIPREQPMETHLTPREIQTRIRRGESPDDIAADTGMPITSIEPFAGAVIAEREYMAQQAQRTGVRRKHVTGSGTRLDELVAQGLRARNQSPDDATWNSFRREDGRWTVLLAFGESTATFLYDAEGRYVLPTDDAAHDLVGDVALPESPDMALADAIRDAEPVAEPAVEPEPADQVEPAHQVDQVEYSGELQLDLELPADIAVAEHLLDDAAILPPVSSLKEARDRRAQTAMSQPETDTEVESEHDHLDEVIEHDIAVPDSAPQPKKRHERRRVPSWDEIMFGDKHD